jgi:tRNA(Met) cytidine acetyltransferase
MDTAAVEALRAEAAGANERRALVLHGERERCYDAAESALAATVGFGETTLVGERNALPCERVGPRKADRLLGTTRDAVVLDCHDETRPNALGRVVGAVDGGGLLLILAPDLDTWHARPDGFDGALAAPPNDESDVTGRFRRRLVTLLRAHPGIAVYNADSGTLEADGLTHPAPRLAAERPEAPERSAFPDAAYRACRTAGQADALGAFEALTDPGNALVLEADRGRGKSATAGLAAACFAAKGKDVLVVAPARRNADELFERADALLSELGVAHEEADAGFRTESGRIRFAKPPDAEPGSPDVLLVDEAAALPVGLLESYLGAPSVAFVTTVHGYEGAGRGFDVRFRDELVSSEFEVSECHLEEPIRYAASDPVESWAFRALALDAKPAVEPLVADATPETSEYVPLPPERLVADENLLRETFGLLVHAHYRTEPNDLARVLDAPNVETRALTHDGHVVAVCLLAREGDLDAATRKEMYEGGRVRGNMIPDVLTSQLRDESAAETAGWRVLRIATHDAARSRGLGSTLIDEIRAEFADADWLGVGFGATPELLRFWSANGFSTVHLSTTRNERSGEYSAVMLDPLSPRGERLHERHAGWFLRRVADVLADALNDLNPDIARDAISGCAAGYTPELDEPDWRLVAGAAAGPGLCTVDPGPFRTLAVRLLADDGVALPARAERLLVRKALQARPWESVTEEMGFHSTGGCMRAFGAAYEPLVDEYGTEAAREEVKRY